MSKRHTDSTPDEKAPKRRKVSAASVLVEAARNGDTTAVRVGLEKLIPDTDSKTVAFDAVHEACRGNHDECLALLLPYVETTQMGFGMLLSECIHADHTACTEVLLQHWKSVCSNVAFVPHGHKDETQGTTPRPCPAMWADPAVCQVLIDAGADIETKDEVGRSPLLRASISGKIAVVKMLVEAGAGVCVTDNHERTCLMLAAYFGHTETVRYLVVLPEVDVNHSENNGYTALHFAVQQQFPDVVCLLIDAGADIEAKSKDGRSPLLLASIAGHLDIVKMLVEAGAGVCVSDSQRYTCLIMASASGHTETVRYLVGLKDVDVNHTNCGHTALHFAVMRNHPGVVEVLFEAGADIEVKDEEGSSPLLLACTTGHLDIVKMLVEAGAGVRGSNIEGVTCLLRATYHGHTEIVRYLVGLPQVDVNQLGCKDLNLTALHLAVVEKHQDIVKVLIDAGAELDRTGEDGRSAPLVASCMDMPDIVKMLVEAGAVVRATDNKGRTCLTLASYFGHTETVRYLAGLKDVEVSHPDADGYTALHFAVQQQFPGVVQELIDAGADIEANNKDKSSPLLLASRSGSFDIVKMLVEAGAGVCVTDNKGDTCLTIAAAVAQEENVRNLLRSLFRLPPEERVTVQATTSQGDNSHRDVAKSAMPGLTEDTRMSEESSVAAQAPVPKLESPDEQDSTSLSTKAPARYVDTVRYLVGLPEVDVNHVNSCGETALHFAVRLPYPDLVQELIAAGADVETKNKDGRSALLLTSMFGKLDIVKMLIGAGAGVCVTDNKGATCLTLAANGGHTDMVHYLVGLPEVDVNHAGENGMTSLHGAVLRKRAEVVQVLIGAGADIERRDNLGRSPLLCASECGGLEVARMLVEAGAGVRITDNDGDTCLILAAHFGHTETVRYFVGLKDVDVHHQGMNNQTALQNAVEEGHPDVVQVLIGAGADIERRDNLGCAPLLVASTLGKLDIVKMLVEAGAGVRVTQDNIGQTCLILAAHHGHTETVRYLVGLPEVEVNYQARNNHTALYSAVQEGHPDVVQVLIDAGADIETKGSWGHSPLECASLGDDVVSVKMLVEAGAAVAEADKRRDSCLLLAVIQGHTETVRYLAGLPQVDVDEVRNRRRALFCAIQQGVHPDVVQALIDGGADMEIRSNVGSTPLLFASSSGHLAIVKVLVGAGADVQAADNKGATCLIKGVWCGCSLQEGLELMRYLVGLPEVDVNHADENGMTALHWAAKRYYPDVVQVLIDGGADIEARNNLGRSPLLVACENGDVAKVKMLVEAGAGVRATDIAGNTCLILAAHFGHTEIMRYLIGLPEVDVHHAANGGETALHVASRRHGHRVAQILLEHSTNASEVTAVGIQPS